MLVFATILGINLCIISPLLIFATCSSSNEIVTTPLFCDSSLPFINYFDTLIMSVAQRHAYLPSKASDFKLHEHFLTSDAENMHNLNSFIIVLKLIFCSRNEPVFDELVIKRFNRCNKWSDEWSIQIKNPMHRLLGKGITVASNQKTGEIITMPADGIFVGIHTGFCLFLTLFKTRSSRHSFSLSPSIILSRTLDVLKCSLQRWQYFEHLSMQNSTNLFKLKAFYANKELTLLEQYLKKIYSLFAKRYIQPLLQTMEHKQRRGKQQKQFLFNRSIAITDGLSKLFNEMREKYAEGIMKQKLESFLELVKSQSETRVSYLGSIPGKSLEFHQFAWYNARKLNVDQDMIIRDFINQPNTLSTDGLVLGNTKIYKSSNVREQSTWSQPLFFVKVNFDHCMNLAGLGQKFWVFILWCFKAPYNLPIQCNTEEWNSRPVVLSVDLPMRIPLQTHLDDCKAILKAMLEDDDYKDNNIDDEETWSIWNKFIHNVQLW